MYHNKKIADFTELDFDFILLGRKTVLKAGEAWKDLHEFEITKHLIAESLVT